MTRNMVFKVVNLLLVSVCTILLGERLTYAEDIYFAQGSSGDVSGNSCSNAKPISALTWGSGTGNIGAGDTLHLCGTITSTLTIGVSGTDLGSGAITVKWEDGAKMSKAAWGTTTSSAIVATGKSNIVFDGGTNGIIENTGNGTALANKVDSFFMDLEGGCSHIEVKNLALSNMYVRMEGTEDNWYGHAIYVAGAFHDIRIHNNTIHDGNKLVSFAYWGDGVRDIAFYNNKMDNAAVLLVVGSGNTGATVDNVLIYNNDFHRGHLWSGQPNIHTDLTHTFAVHTGSEITNLQIYNNYYHGSCGTNVTTEAYLEGNITGAKFYNNVLMLESDSCGGLGMMYIKGNNGTLVDNNTFVSTDINANTAIYSGAGSTNVVIKNNIFKNLAVSISEFDSTSGIVASDYNVFPSATVFNYGSWSQISYTSWKSARGFDTHSTMGTPMLVPKYPSPITIK